MRANRAQACLEGVVGFVHAFRVFVLVLEPRDERAPPLGEPPGQIAAPGIVGDPLGHDIARTLEGIVGRGHVLAQTWLGQAGERFAGPLLGQNLGGERFQPAFSRDHCPRAALGPVRQIQVFDRLQGVGLHYRPFERGGELALPRDGGQDRVLPLGQFAQIGEPVQQPAQLFFVQAAGCFFAVTRDEGNGVPIVEQGYCALHLLAPEGQLGGQAADDISCGHHAVLVGNKQARIVPQAFGVILKRQIPE